MFCIFFLFNCYNINLILLFFIYIIRIYISKNVNYFEACDFSNGTISWKIIVSPPLPSPV